MKKKVITLLFVASVSLSFLACGESNFFTREEPDVIEETDLCLTQLWQ